MILHSTSHPNEIAKNEKMFGDKTIIENRENIQIMSPNAKNQPKWVELYRSSTH
jgi:hypothetical protein